MDIFQNLEPKHYIILFIAVLFIAKKAMVNQPFVKKYNLLISSLLLFALAVMISLEFWGDNKWVVVVVLLLGFVAVAKVLYDMLRK